MISFIIERFKYISFKLKNFFNVIIDKLIKKQEIFNLNMDNNLLKSDDLERYIYNRTKKYIDLSNKEFNPIDLNRFVKICDETYNKDIENLHEIKDNIENIEYIKIYNKHFNWNKFVGLKEIKLINKLEDLHEYVNEVESKIIIEIESNEELNKEKKIVFKSNKFKIDEKYIDDFRKKHNVEVNIIKKEKDLTKLYKDNPQVNRERNIILINPSRNRLLTEKRMLEIQSIHKNSLEKLRKEKLDEEKEDKENEK
uniref:Uncharacterized protein n=1 Tax=Acrasis kona TaxID=1008807 RepID=A0A0B4MZ13_9EUKA|nr:hypothetical protein [Acrasis kona]AID52049.1 hypothetical protein [Acrasis kona]